jgi:UDP-3-O-[3-hydroxymyristoyl] glucosamine N-acyltransferase
MTAGEPSHTLFELSERFRLEVRGDSDCVIDGIGTLASAGPSQITFLANPAYRKALPETRAGAVILSEADAADCPVNCLIAPDPYLAYARIAALFDSRPLTGPGVHASAVVSESASLGRNVSIGANAVIGEGCKLGDGCTVGPGTVIEAGCRLGEGCRLYANVTLGFGVRLGKRVTVHPGAVIGADGFGIAFNGEAWEKVPQLGSVDIGDDCEIGANTCIDRGAVEDTVLEEDVRIDNLCQVGHNVRIGAHTAVAGTSALAGSVKIGRNCLLAGGSGVSGHLNIADRTTIAAGTNVFRSISEPGTTLSSELPARPLREWQRTVARLNRLDDMARRVARLEKQLGKQNDNE